MKRKIRAKKREINSGQRAGQKTGKSRKRTALRALAFFFAVMAVCTVLSRAASSVLTAQVETANPESGNITDTYEGMGEAVPSVRSQIFLWPEQQVEESAPAGTEVRKGECLVQFRLEYLEQTIEKKQSQIDQLVLQMRQQEIAAEGAGSVPSATGASRTLEGARAQLQAADKNVENARTAYDTYNGEDEAEKQALSDALETALSEKTAAKQAVREAEGVYEDAKARDAVQEENDAAARETARLSAQQIQIQIDEAQKELDVLKGYQAEGGKICAREDCVVLENGVADGTLTSGSELIVTGSGAWRLRGILSDEMDGKLPEGTKIRVSPDAGGSDQEVTLTSLDESGGSSSEAGGDTTPDSSGADGGKAGDSAADTGSGVTAGYWYAPVPEGMDVRYGDTFAWKASVPSEKSYSLKIPLAALREDTGGNYCLVVEEESSPLGTVKRARRVDVSVLKKNGEEAAVDGVLEKTDRVIVSSEKYVEEGDQVRIKD